MATKKAVAKQAVAKKTVAKKAIAKKAVAAKPAPKVRPARQKASGKGAAAEDVRARLEKAIPEPRCELAHRNGFELLIATILSAQSTDKAVNSVTPTLFARWPTPEKLAKAAQEDVEEVVKRTGFFRNKAKAIRGTSEALVANFGGEVPRTLEELVTLPGVARKTANVVLGTAYGISSGFVVDTHVARVSQRLGLTAHEAPPRIEADLCAQFEDKEWPNMGHRVLLHGRYTCLAKRPLCDRCPLFALCPSAEGDEPTISWQSLAEEEAVRVQDGYEASGALIRGA